MNRSEVVSIWSCHSSLSSQILTFTPVRASVWHPFANAELVMRPVCHGVGRELDDDELFGDDGLSVLRRSSGSLFKNFGESSKPADLLDTVKPVIPPTKRLRPAVESVTKSGGAIKKPKSTVERVPEWERLRLSEAKPPKSLKETVSEFTLPEDEDMARRIDGAPRLSTLACMAFASLLNTTRSVDLSYIPDYHAFSLLTYARLSADVLTKIEERNPTRVRLLDAVWATVVNRLYKIENRPSNYDSWRAVHEGKVADEEERLRRASDRLRIEYARNSNKKVIAKLDSRRSMRLEPKRGTSHGSVPLTRMEQLRMQARKDRRRSGR